MNSLVDLEMSWLGEALVADLAAVGFEAEVDICVMFELQLSGEALKTSWVFTVKFPLQFFIFHPEQTGLGLSVYEKFYFSCLRSLAVQVAVVFPAVTPQLLKRGEDLVAVIAAEISGDFLAFFNVTFQLLK